MEVARFTFESLIPDKDLLARKANALSLEEFGANDEALNGNAGASVTPEEPPAPPPPPTFTEAELEAAKLSAHEEGFMAGKLEGKREAEHKNMEATLQLANALEEVHNVLPDLLEEQAAFLASKQSELGSLVLHCAGKLALEALRKDPLADIEAMVNETMQLLMGKQELTVKVNSKLHIPLARKLGKEIRVEPDDELSPGDCHVQWNNGEAKREIDHIWSQIEEVIERYFAPQQKPLEPSETLEQTENVTGEQHG